MNCNRYEHKILGNSSIAYSNVRLEPSFISAEINNIYHKHYVSLHNISPVQNIIGHNNCLIVVCDKYLLNISVGSSFPF